MLHTLLIIHSVLVLFLIVLVLLQKSGSGALSGLSGGGGGSMGVFTAQGGKNFMTRLTAILATLFLCSSLGLAMLSKKDNTGKGTDASIADEIIREEQQKGAPALPEKPVTPSVPLAQ